MAYSLNPKDLREELQTYKQPVYVASTQPAQQSVAPASTSQYRQVKRADGGTDFFNGNQKTTIEEYSRGTGNQIENVRGNLAAGGSKFDQNILNKQYFETKDPEVSKFNTLDLGKQRERLAQLREAASRKDFNTTEDVRNQRWASEQLANVEAYGTKKAGDFGTFIQDLGGGFIAPAQKIIGSVVDTAQQASRGQKLLDFYKSGQINRDEFNSAAQSVLQNSIDRKAELDANGNLVGRQATPIEFAQKFIGEGADAGLTYSPIGAGYKAVAGQALKQAAPTIAKNILKEGTAYTAANVANDLIQGREITPGSLLINAATSYGGAALGAGGALLKPVAKAGGEAVSTGAKNVARAVENVNPQLAQLNETILNYQKAFDVETNPVQRERINQGIAQLNAERRGILQRGSIEIPGKAPETPDVPIVQPTVKSALEADLETAGIVPTAKSKFASTVLRSNEVSDPLKTKVRESQPRYTVTTDEARIAQSEQYLKSQGLGKATTNIKERLISDKIDDQTASDAIAVAKRLDARSTTKSLQEATDIYEQLAEKFSKAGQLVQAASLLGNRTPEGLRFSAIKSLKKEGVPITPEMTKNIDNFIQQVKKTTAGSYENGLARDQLMKYVGKQLPQRKMSQALQIWKAGLLTSPRTTAGNIAANTAESILRKGYVDPLANMIDAATAFFFTGQRSRKFTLRGIGSGTGEGIAKGIKYFKTGYDPRNPNQKFDVRNVYYSDKPLGKAAEAYTQSVFRLMGAQDQPFYYAALRNSLYDQALTEASRQKLRGTVKQDFIKQFVTEPQTKAMNLADEEARYAVFQNETQLGKMASRVKSSEGVGGDIAEFLVPFSGVPSSVATRMIERTPIGWATTIVKAIKDKKAGKAFDQRGFTQAIASGSMAIPLIGAGAALANAGIMTLGYPTDKKERDLWEAEGKQPYSIKVGDQWLSTNYFQPAGNLLAAGAEYQNAVNNGENPETAYGNAIAGAGKALTEQSFLKGVSGGINALTDPTRSAEKFAEQTVGSVVPNVVRTIARATDPVQRETNGVIDAVTGGIPGARQTLPEKTNIYGEAVPRRGSMIDEIINPLKPSKDLTADNKMTEELRLLQGKGEGITPTQATKTSIEGADDKTLQEINKRVSKEVTNEWQKVMDDPRYQNLNDEDKKRILARVNDAVFGSVKSDYKTDTKLTNLQQLYKKGSNPDYFANFDLASDSGLGATKLPSNSKSSSFLLDATAINSLDKKQWEQSPVKTDYKELVDNVNNAIPEGLPKVPETNAVAQIYAQFEKDKADNNWSSLQLKKESNKVLVDAYKSQLTDNEKFVSTLSDKEIQTAVKNGEVSQQEIDNLIGLDNILSNLGSSQMIGNTTRKALGYGTIASKSSSGGTGAKKNYKLNAFGDVGGQVSGNLRKLIEQATIKGV